MGQIQRFEKRLQRAVSAIQDSQAREAIILHHDEADGLTSATLSKIALEHLGLQTKLICLDKLYPEVVREIESDNRRVIAYVDLGSGHVDWLVKENRSKNLILVLDHHDTAVTEDSLLHNLNPELDGFSGEKEASSATVAYFFGKAVDSSLSRYAHLASIGGEELPGEASGLNLTAITEGKNQGLLRESGRDYRIKVEGMEMSRSRASTLLNVLGSVGYYRSGPSMGIEACESGFRESTIAAAKKFEDERKQANQQMLDHIRKSGLIQKKNVQWFHAHDNYDGMGAKVVGSFCSYLRYQRGVNPVRYLLGMMNVPSEIPGWRNLPSSLVKVSGRAPQILAKLIEKGSKPPLSRILPDSCSKAGGFGDGHSVAASGVFPPGREDLFVEEIDRLAV